MSRFIYRAIAFVLVAVMLFGCISCRNNEPAKTLPDYDENRRFELITEAPTYSEEFIERAAVSFADIGELLVLLLKNVKVSELQKVSLKNYFKTEVFPIIVMAQIYSHEVDALFSATLEYLKKTDEEKTSFEVLAKLYNVATDAVDAKRVGIVAFELSRLMVSEKAEDSRKKYEKYGYPWYLDDAERYETLLSNLTGTLGRNKFIKMSNIAFFVLSSVWGLGAPENEIGLSVNEREAVAILEVQADFFCEAAISAEEWKIFAQILTELVPKNNTSLMNAELYALKQSNYFVSIAEAMPQLIALYEATTNRLCESGTVLYSDSGEFNAKGIVGAVISSDTELRAFLDKLETCGASRTKAETDAITSMKLTAEYESFISEYGVKTQDEFVEALKELSESDAETSPEVLYELILTYTVGVAPYVTFAVCNQK